MELSRYKKEEFFQFLDKNEGLEKVIKSIYYADKANVDILNISTQLELDVVLEYIDMKLKQVNEEKTIVRVSLMQGPEYFFKKTEAYYNKNENYLFVFDGTLLEYDYKYLFEVINRQRNQLLDKLASPMIFVLPKHLLKDFAYGAADFWSVKKFSVLIELSLREENQEVESKNTFRSYLKRLFNSEKVINLEVNSELQALLDQVESLETRFKSEKFSVITARLYLISLMNLGDYYKKYSTLKNSLTIYRMGLALAQRIENTRPDSIEAKREVSISLERIADIYLQKGDADKALKHYQESLALAQRIENTRPDSIEAKRDLSVSLYKISEVYKFQKEFEMAKEQLLKARALILPFKEYEYGDFASIIEIFEKEIEEMG